uniref:Uncharacterized protein n=1 Tax=Brassica oleracea TaxID=3712 RepID=A0A3P6GK43_BRAOL|nr:unnamed protein product [Brassica oleracea]
MTRTALMATIKMDNDVSVTMSMFDSQPVKLHNQLESMGGDPRVWLQPVSTPKLWEAHAYILTRKPSQWLPKTLGLRQQLHCLRATTRWNP